MTKKSNEHDLQNRIRNQLAGKALIFRGNVGKGFTASPKDTFRISKQTAMVLERGDVLLRNARIFDTGLPPGFSDLFGAVTKVITADMVGMRAAIFTALEVKDQAAPSEGQRDFLNAINYAGGIGAIVRSEEDACRVLGVEYEQKLKGR